jgi:hypothetical protein
VLRTHLCAPSMCDAVRIKRNANESASMEPK